MLSVIQAFGESNISGYLLFAFNSDAFKIKEVVDDVAFREEGAT